MANHQLAVALLSEVFPSGLRRPEEREHLAALLGDARRRGGELAVLPELPLHPWSPAQPQPRVEDAEPPAGPRHQALAVAARDAGVALLGGALVEERGVRRNRALLFDRDGGLLTFYDKCHLPHERGFWERAHYREGEVPPRVVAVEGFPVGIQLCSDLNRPELSHALAAAGALAILGPRATEASSWPRWRRVLESTALTACAYVLSVTRPRAEADVALGGPSFAAGPEGIALVESTDVLTMVRLERAAVAQARRSYPGYLHVRPDLYAAAWQEATQAQASAALAAEAAGPSSDAAAVPQISTLPLPIWEG